MPYRRAPALRALARRAIPLVILARLGFGVVLVMKAALLQSAPETGLPPITAVAFAGLSGGLMLIDCARRGDILLFRNLGVGPGVIAVSAAVPALVLEAVIGLVVRP